MDPSELLKRIETYLPYFAYHAPTDTDLIAVLDASRAVVDGAARADTLTHLRSACVARGSVFCDAGAAEAKAAMLARGGHPRSAPTDADRVAGTANYFAGRLYLLTGELCALILHPDRTRVRPTAVDLYLRAIEIERKHWKVTL